MTIARARHMGRESSFGPARRVYHSWGARADVHRPDTPHDQPMNPVIAGTEPGMFSAAIRPMTPIIARRPLLSSARRLVAFCSSVRPPTKPRGSLRGERSCVNATLVPVPSLSPSPWPPHAPELDDRDEARGVNLAGHACARERTVGHRHLRNRGGGIARGAADVPPFM